jgi:hypothetical protein
LKEDAMKSRAFLHGLGAGALSLALLMAPLGVAAARGREGGGGRGFAGGGGGARGGGRSMTGRAGGGFAGPRSGFAGRGGFAGPRGFIGRPGIRGPVVRSGHFYYPRGFFHFGHAVRFFGGFSLGFYYPYYYYPYAYPYPYGYDYAPGPITELTNTPPPGCYYYDPYGDVGFDSLDEYWAYMRTHNEPLVLEVIEERTDRVLRTFEYVDGRWVLSA